MNNFIVGGQVLFLALRMPLDGIVPQIMSLPPHMLEAKPMDPAAGKTWTYPPVYFVHMELDRATAQRVTADINVLKTKQARPMLGLAQHKCCDRT